MSRAQVRTLKPDGSRQRYLGELGPVSGLTYSFTVPGGCDQLTCSLGIPPVRRTDGMDPGRITQVILGADVVWEGILDEPEPADGGWTLTAHGSGTWGSQFAVTYGGTWASAVPDQAIGNAIGRGLGWLPPNEGHPAGIFLGQPADSGMMQVDAMLTQITSLGGLTWQVARGPSGNDLQLFPLTTVANRLLVCTDPAARTLGGDINAVCIRYNSVPDLGAGYPAKYATVFATDDASIGKHGRTEVPLDLSSNGPMPASDALAVGNYVLQRYQRASFAGPFTVTPGQLLTLGGQPVDLGVYFSGAPMVCRLILADQGWGGEVTQQQVSFLVGAYEVDDDTGSATVTPFGTLRHDFAALLAQRASRAKGRQVDVWRGSGALLWEFRGSRDWHERWKNGVHTRNARWLNRRRRHPGGGGGPG